MKLTAADFEVLRRFVCAAYDGCEPSMDRYRLEIQISGFDPPERVRWDVFFAAVPEWFRVQLYHIGYNDAHIDTAMRRAIKSLEIPLV